MLADTVADLHPDRGAASVPRRTGCADSSARALARTARSSSPATPALPIPSCTSASPLTGQWMDHAPGGCLAAPCQVASVGRSHCGRRRVQGRMAARRISEQCRRIGSASRKNGWDMDSAAVMTAPDRSGWRCRRRITRYPVNPAAQCSNPISPAILILQQLQQGKEQFCNQCRARPTGNNAASTTAGNWIPINFYDSREGEPRDNGRARPIPRPAPSRRSTPPAAPAES